ncbi:MAG TPA: carboxylating nicotinate-nucleotide diphosphorylase [Thermoanaerobaculia bacterium]|nr:carboxylating nicotinate-nucleotide diphosphorylase [Thermoanaerobaculia bacterium]
MLLDREAIRKLVQRALDEDLPDITAEAIFEPADRGTAELVIKSPGIIAGLEFAELTFAILDSSARFLARVEDGAAVKAGDVVAEVNASVIALLSGERTALNFVQRASGIATMTRRYVDAVAGTKAKIYDTRKTAPGLRLLDKYAAAAGGGENHRFGLFDMVLVKNNHIDRAGSIKAAVERIRAAKPRTEDRGPRTNIMVEVRNMGELDQALAVTPDFILLDNMTPDQMRAAVQRTGGRVPLEASGGITLENVRAVAESGVDRISIGALTHSVRALDISMRIKN